MKRTTGLILGTVAVSCLFLSGGNAQFYSPRPATNPYTGARLPAPRVNPLTGRTQTGVRNPYTGQVAAPTAGYNPLTGRMQSGLPGSPQPPAGSAQWPSGPVPVTGKSGPGLEAFDRAVLKIMDHHGIPGAGLAIARKGKLIYARGFGWADLRTGTPVQPMTFFTLASLSKPITAIATLLLVERGKLRFEDRALDYLKHIRPPPGARVDPRLRQVTIRQLLNHTGGWDRSVSGDPVTWSPQIARALRVPQPLSTQQFISFMMSRQLNFAPGTKYAYSNVGYMLLDEIIEKVSGERYEVFVRRNVLQPAGIDRVFLSTARRNYRPDEAHCYLAGTSTLLPPMSLPMARAAAGWTASAVDMVRFLTALDGSHASKLLQDRTFAEMVASPPPPVKKQANGTYAGLGWPIVGPSGKSFGYMQDGHWPGARTFMKCNPAKGVNWALLFNVSMHPDPIDQRAVLDAVREVQQQIEQIERLPDLDLFSEYR
jgi:CubicO group peptidase (beta-lactamase class C family)